MKDLIGDKARLQHILLAISEMEKYVDGYSISSFLSDSKTHFATIKQLEIIGEAANHLSSETINISTSAWKMFGEPFYRPASFKNYR